MTVKIEQKIALGWPDERIGNALGVSVLKVAGVRRALDSLAGADIFALTEPQYGGSAVKDRCSRDHLLTEANTYRRRGNGRRECVICKDRRNRERYMMAAA